MRGRGPRVGASVHGAAGPGDGSPGLDRKTLPTDAPLTRRTYQQGMASQARVETLQVEDEVKPMLRGVSHAIAFVAALAGCFFLAMAPAEGVRHLAGMVFGISL